MGNKSYTPRERRLVADYASIYWLGKRVIFNPRLGPVPLEAGRAVSPNINPKALSTYRRYPDAVVDLGETVMMVEAKLIASGAAVGMLEEYMMLWGLTSDYGELHQKPMTGAILTAFTDPYARTLAEQHGFTWLVYAPSWVMTDLMSSEFNLSPPFTAGLSSTLQPGGSSSGST